MSAQKVVSRIKRVGKEAYQFKFSSTFEYIKLKCNGTWRPTQLRVVWFRNCRRVESIPVHWVVSEDRGPNGASGKGKFQPAFCVGLVVTLYKSTFAEKFDGKEYKYYIQDESEKGTKVLASFKIDLGEFANTYVQDSTNMLEMTFHCESSKVEDVVLEMTLSSRLLKSGNALDNDMQSTFSAITSENDGMVIDSDDDEEEGEGVSGGPEVRENGMDVHVAEVEPLQLVNRAEAKPELNRIQNEKEKKMKSQFRHVPIKDQQGGETFPQSPPPLPPHPSLTDSVHRPREEITEMIQRLQQCVQKLENENKVLHASMEIQGWLFKRGVKGLTARVWRKRFFRCEGINKIFYYKTICSQKPQGFIDLDLVLGVKEACSEEQDKNCSTFLIHCEGRTYQLQAIDQMTMKKWMSAIQFLSEWRKSHSQREDKESTDDAISNS